MRIDFTSNIGISALLESATERSREALREAVERRQDLLLEQLCGPMRKPRGCRRAGTYRKTIITSMGEVRLRLVKVTDGRRTWTPILEELGIKGRRYSMDVVARCADLATRLSYHDASEQFRRVTGVYVPKGTIHSFVQRVAGMLMEARGAGKGTIFADSTEVRAIRRREMNRVDVAVAWSDGKKSLVHIGVNEGWRKLEGSEMSVLVSDGDRELNRIGAERRQLCILHALRLVTYELWKGGMGRRERLETEQKMKGILFKLVNAVKGGLEGEELRGMIRRTIEELERLAKTLFFKGYRNAASFIRRNARMMVAFAEMAMEGMRIPYTSNLIERLMGEVSKRCKNRWMHWSEKGLRSILTLVLVRYTEPVRYEEFMERLLLEGGDGVAFTAQF